MEIYTTSQARANLFKLVEQASESHDPVFIVGKKAKAVLISEEDYKAMQETLHIMSIPGLKESILAASKRPIKEFSEEIDWENV